MLPSQTYSAYGNAGSPNEQARSYACTVFKCLHGLSRCLQLVPTESDLYTLTRGILPEVPRGLKGVNAHSVSTLQNKAQSFEKSAEKIDAYLENRHDM